MDCTLSLCIPTTLLRNELPDHENKAGGFLDLTLYRSIRRELSVRSMRAEELPKVSFRRIDDDLSRPPVGVTDSLARTFGCKPPNRINNQLEVDTNLSSFLC